MEVASAKDRRAALAQLTCRVCENERGGRENTGERKRTVAKKIMKKKTEEVRKILYLKELKADAPGIRILSRAMMQSEAIHQNGRKKCPRETP